MPAPARSSRSPAAPNAADAAGHLLVALPPVMDTFRGVMRRQLDPSLSVPQFRALRFVADRRGSSISELAAFLGVTLPTASAMVDRLIRSGHLESRVAAGDRRRTELAATASGVALMKLVRRGAQHDLAQHLLDLSNEELACVTQAMSLLQRSFSHA